MTDAPRIIPFRCPATGLVYDLPIDPTIWPEPIPAPANHPLNKERRRRLRKGTQNIPFLIPLLIPQIGRPPDDGERRVPGGFVRDHEVRQSQKWGGTMPVSRSLPRRKGGTPDTLHGRQVLKHPDGGLTDRLGRPIVASRRDRDREEKRTGYVFDQGSDDSDVA